ncbi:MAG: 2-C-methyl-D-erythritol 4-phosphate cytidylyltransferase [Treponema sp.]|nr:2-C-methyl-D-erythritol 4-phosphate cytidylyltransferase [Treponema sp.]MCL2273176.1 2-C-methyl-D-erythritol 4-phosphate cytidylyltransferase [Treponema sp.]
MSEKNEQIGVIVLSAGESSRMNGIKKEFYRLDSGKSVLETVLGAFSAVKSIEIIVVVIRENEEKSALKALPKDCLSLINRKIFLVTGGDSRRASVFNALSFLEARSPGYVLIHDGARPWVSPSLIERTIEVVKKYDAVIPLLPFIETPKECDAPFIEDNRTVFIKTHLKRAQTGGAQTPQAFRFSEILRAHEKAALAEGEQFTDDAEIWGRFCGKVAVIQGEPENRKITFPEDLR